MRPSPLFLAVSLALLSACSPAPTHEQSAASSREEGDEIARQRAGQPAPPPVAMATIDAKVEKQALAETAAADGGAVDQVMVTGARLQAQPPASPRVAALNMPASGLVSPNAVVEANTEHYQAFDDNPIQRVAENPVSTFSIDVDTGSYSNVRRMLVAGERPPADAVRAEEMINYFDYGYPAPATREQPFRVSTEIAPAPWNARHQLLQIGIQGYDVPKAQIPAANLVFLIDTSGSMDEPDKLPLLKDSFRQLVSQLRPQDRVSIVVYAGSAGLVLPPTPGDQKATILASLDQLQAGGSTNGGQGLQLAYATARQSFQRNGVNRVILATDGDFNVGTFDQKALETMIADQRKSGIALTTLGFGSGNYNDAMAERLADVGNGNHAYIDSPMEGRKVLVEEVSSTLLTIAQDVKIQLEFNPAVVAEYRLIGYEDRALRREDFNNDQVDAGEIGAGHDVTALYEITLVGSGGESVDPLRYGKAAPMARASSDEIGLLRLRYKLPGATTSRLIESPMTRAQVQPQASPRLRWAAAVAAYADLLRGGRNDASFNWNQVRNLAQGAIGEDRGGYRHEFLQLLDRARSVTGGAAPVAVGQ